MSQSVLVVVYVQEIVGFL